MAKESQTYFSLLPLRHVQTAQNVKIYWDDVRSAGGEAPPTDAEAEALLDAESDKRRNTQANPNAPGTLLRLSVPELKILLKRQSIDYSLCIEKQEMVAALRAGLGMDSATPVEEEISQLSLGLLKAILTHREIPYHDCVEKRNLVQRCCVTHRGAVIELPDVLLRQMLQEGGLPPPSHEVGHGALVRRVMAMKALRQAQREAGNQRPPQPPPWPGNRPPRVEAEEPPGEVRCSCSLQ